MLGYNKPLYILPFDHKTGFYKAFLGFENREPTSEEVEEVKNLKQIIYEGFLMGVEMGIPKESALILVDETYGADILRDAKEKGFQYTINTEKSGQKELQFEFGTEFGQHIEEFDPHIVKVLVRYNPEEDHETNIRQLARLRELDEYAKKTNRKFMIEPLVPPTEGQLASVEGNKHRYDSELRPGLTVRMIEELHTAGVEPDIWKIEGFESSEAYKQVVEAACLPTETRNEVGIIVLGRGETMDKVFEWLDAGKNVSHNIIGFAIGRTIFGDGVKGFKSGTMTREEAIKDIATNYYNFYKFFIK